MSERNLKEDEIEILNKIKASVYSLDLAWKSFLYFFAESKERAEFFAETSPLVSSLLANLLWDATLTRIRALTDVPRSRSNTNLSIGHLVRFCGETHRADFEAKLQIVDNKSREARVYATKHIAHFDLRTKLNPEQVSINRRQTTDAVDAIWNFIFCFHTDVLDIHLCREVVRAKPTEEEFLELLFLGEKASAKRRKEFTENFLKNDDYQNPLPSLRDGLPRWLWSEKV